MTADVSLDIPSNGTFYFRRTTEIRTAPVMDIKPTLSLVQATMLSMTRS
ncbi:MAG: hypothetical protein ACLTKL_01350 [Streptococcus salivarius]